jgi:hypothetical protein
VLVGAQLLIFGGFARLYGIQEGITREDKHARWARWLSFERCVAAGLLIGLVGVINTVVAVTDWGSTGFGALDPRETLRMVVPSATAIALGVILIFSGLFASLLSLRPAVRRSGAPTVANTEPPIESPAEIPAEIPVEIPVQRQTAVAAPDLRGLSPMAVNGPAADAFALKEP